MTAGWSITTTERAGSGLFLVFEGIEGAGKSTQVRRLSRWLDKGGVDHVVTREPGGTRVGEALRTVILDDPELSILPETELFLVLAARAAFVREVVRPALAAGRVVLADRYDLSTIAYQGHGRQLDLDAVRSANRVATDGVRPDLCVVLDVPVEVGLRRQRDQGKKADRMEREGRDFLERVRAGYLEAVRTEGRVAAVDGAVGEEDVQLALRTLLRSEFPETFAALPEYQ